jgi:hypothetical protein
MPKIIPVFLPSEMSPARFCGWSYSTDNLEATDTTLEILID